MGAGDRTPELLRCTLRLTAAALAAASWLAAPAGAAGALDGHAPAGASTGVTERLAAAAGSAGATVSDAAGTAAAQRPVRGAMDTVAAAGTARGAVKSAAAGTVRGAVEPAVGGPVRDAEKTVAAARSVGTVVETAATVRPLRAAAETLAAVAPRPRPAIGEATRRLADAAPGADGPPQGGNESRPAAAIRDAHGGEGAGVTAQAARLQAAGAAGAPHHRPTVGSASFAWIAAHPAAFIALRSGAVTDSASAGSGPAPAALEHRSSPGPAPPAGGGAALSAGAASFLMGGLAVLLATLSLAGPALRRRLPSRTVTAWPSAFVPLLERPG